MHVLRHIGIGFIWAIGGYVVGVLITYLLIIKLSQNQHDRSTEAAMTAFFAGGPFAAVLAFIISIVHSIRTS